MIKRGNQLSDQSTSQPVSSLIGNDKPLFALARQGVVEVVASGVSYYKVQDQEVEGDNPDIPIVARSLIKPWQFIASKIQEPEDYWALGLASHSGQPHHLIKLQQLLEVAEVGEEDLVCPRVYPLDPNAAAMLRYSGVEPSRLHHPCSGKHLVMLIGCQRSGFPTASYWHEDHPMQKAVQAAVGQVVGERPIWMIDSCGLPTIAVSARAHLLMWERFSRATDGLGKFTKKLWLRGRRLIGGFGRLDSDLMEILPNRIVAKEGADGLLMVQTLPFQDEPVAGCMIKLSGGYNSAYLSLALYSTLCSLPQLTPPFKAVLNYLKSRLERWVPKDQKILLPPFQ